MKMDWRSKDELLKGVAKSTDNYQRALLEVFVDIRDMLVEINAAREREVKHTNAKE